MSEKRICKYCGMDLSEDVPHGLRECHLRAVARIAELETKIRHNALWQASEDAEERAHLEKLVLDLKERIAELEAFIDRLIELGEWGVTGMVIATSFSGGEIHVLAERRQNEWLTLVKDWKERKE